MSALEDRYAAMSILSPVPSPAGAPLRHLNLSASMPSLSHAAAAAAAPPSPAWPPKSASIAIAGASAARRRSRSSFSTSPHPAALGAHSVGSPGFARSPKPSPAAASPSLIAPGMVHKAQASASAPANRHAFACETCGKRYKHPHCLSKHRWEHTEHWKETSNLSISKHQRVLLLEAASVLVDFSAKSAVPQRTPPSRQGVPDNDEFDNDDNDDNDDIDADDTGIRDHDDDEFIDVERLSDADGHPGLAAQALMLGSTSSLV